ncbi:MAG: TlpA family protein disulfide reductase [Candidatus Omnitrophica bacterium]|nr:TlpA family protein disulfide reductase [Candidatus Omnitrophota bacterium]
MIKKISFFLLICCLALSVLAEDEVKFSSLTGQEFSFEELTAHPNTVLFTWATWCVYCRRELARLAEQCTFFEDVEVFFVNIGEKKTAVERFTDREEFKDCVKDKIILDSQYLIAKEFNIVGIPTYLFFKDGQLIEKSYFLNQKLIDKAYHSQ